MTQYEKKPQEEGYAMKPADQAVPGTPGTGEALCPACGGHGNLEGRPCPDCAGTGIVTQGIGGA